MIYRAPKSEWTESGRGNINLTKFDGGLGRGLTLEGWGGGRHGGLRSTSRGHRRPATGYRWVSVLDRSRVCISRDNKCARARVCVCSIDGYSKSIKTSQSRSASRHRTVRGQSRGMLMSVLPHQLSASGAITSKIKHAIKLKTSPARLAQLLQPSLAFCFSLQPMTRGVARNLFWGSIKVFGGG